MPYKKHIVDEKLALPSDPDYYVIWRPAMTYGELRQYAKDHLPAKGEEGDSSMAASINILAHIQDWNLDDEEGSKLPLTLESLDILDEVDVTFLTEKLTSHLLKRDDDRKNSVNTSTPLSKEPSTVKGGRS